MIRKFIITICLLGMASSANAMTKTANDAYLKVFTKTEEVNDGGYLWVRNIPYTIFSDKGKKTKWVRNDSGKDLVILPPGKYVIVSGGTENKEIIGAVLEQGKLTEVHLMGGAYDN
jgi:hypothetical protein